MVIKKAEMMTKSELTSFLNRRTYKSIELFDDVTPEVVDLVKKIKRSEGISLLVLKK